ncbi:MAG: response regulator transcription factor [Bacillota bacterium]
MSEPKILVVDDDQNVLEILTMYLKKENYMVITADNGKKALRKARNANPDLIILDIMMPEIDGKEVMTKLFLSGKN